MTKIEILVLHWTKEQLFVLCISCLKYQNNILSTKHRTKTKFVQHLKLCPVMFCLVLSCTILSSTYILRIKQTLKEKESHMAYSISFDKSNGTKSMKGRWRFRFKVRQSRSIIFFRIDLKEYLNTFKCSTTLFGKRYSV
jgi:hypothetical protein